MGVLISFLTGFFTKVLSWLFSAVVLKFLIFGIVFLSITEVLPLIITLLMPEQSTNIGSLLSNVPSEVAYFLAFFKVDVGVKLMLSAYLARFIVRRIPFLG